jgi:hypothetical protein
MKQDSRHLFTIPTLWVGLSICIILLGQKSIGLYDWEPILLTSYVVNILLTPVLIFVSAMMRRWKYFIFGMIGYGLLLSSFGSDTTMTVFGWTRHYSMYFFLVILYGLGSMFFIFRKSV